MNNKDIRQLAAEKGVKLWQIADELGIADTTFSKWLRRDLKPDIKESVAEAINTIVAKREAG